MITIFDTKEQFNTYTDNGQNIPSGFLYYVKEDETVHFNTNNIDGTQEIKNGLTDPEAEGYIIPTGNVSLTENGENINIAQYATASVAVPQPSGNVTLTENGTGIDIAQYATATVNVAASPTDLIDLIERDITSINIPSGTTTIGVYAFYVCPSLTSITIPNSVTTIGQQAFQSCSGLTSITIPDSVTTIGQNAFNSCIGLTSLVLNGGGVIGESAFYGCTGLTSVTIGNSVTTIGSTAFQSCRGLTSIEIPDSVTTLGGQAFRGCSGLTSVTIGNGMTNLGGSTFHECTSITSVTIQATTPPTVGNVYTFTGTYPIYVPAESVDTYKAASGWSTYASRIQAIPTGPSHDSPL